MADESTPVAEETTQTSTVERSGEGSAKTFTQEQVNRLIQERVARVKAEPPADYEELKAKAAKLDEMEDAQKSEIERVTEQADKARQDASEWQAKYEKLETERRHELEVRKAAGEYGVDVDVLMRMSGDVAENARFLKDKDAARPKFGDMADGGEQRPQGRTLEDIRAIKDPQERIRARAEYIRNHPNE